METDGGVPKAVAWVIAVEDSLAKSSNFLKYSGPRSRIMLRHSFRSFSGSDFSLRTSGVSSRVNSSIEVFAELEFVFAD